MIAPWIGLRGAIFCFIRVELELICKAVLFKWMGGLDEGLENLCKIRPLTCCIRDRMSSQYYCFNEVMARWVVSRDVIMCNGHVTWDPKTQVPFMLAGPQHGGKVPDLEPQETVEIWLIIIKVRF